jgi:predicted PurR-regulated permease PerM
MNETSNPLCFPYYAKIAMILLALFLLFYGIYLGQDILLPLGFSFLFSILLRPLEIFITRCRVPKAGAILLSIFFAVLFVYGIIDFISRQIASFMSDLPAIERNLNTLWREIKRWGYDTFGFNYRQQDQMLENAKTGTIDSLGGSSGTFNLITASVLRGRAQREARRRRQQAPAKRTDRRRMNDARRRAGSGCAPTITVSAPASTAPFAT